MTLKPCISGGGWIETKTERERVGVDRDKEKEEDRYREREKLGRFVCVREIGRFERSREGKIGWVLRYGERAA